VEVTSHAGCASGRKQGKKASPPALSLPSCLPLEISFFPSFARGSLLQLFTVGKALLKNKKCGRGEKVMMEAGERSKL